MGLAEDLAAVFQEVGPEVAVHKYSDDSIFHEFIDFSNESSSAFVLYDEYMSSCIFPHSTHIEEGDKIVLTLNGDVYIVLFTEDEIFENEAISKQAIIYQCNHIISVYRRDGETRDENYDLIPNWVEVFIDEDVLFVGKASSKTLVQQPYGNFRQGENKIYASKFLDMRENDRCILHLPDEDVPFRIKLKEVFSLPGVFEYSVEYDTRE